MPTHAILFDIGRVVVGFNTSIVSHQLSSYSPLTVYSINNHVFRVFPDGKRNKLLEDFEEGHITVSEFYNQVRNLIEAGPSLTLERFIEIWTSMFYENRGIDDIICDLRARGCICIAISNTDEIIWDWLTRNVKTVRNNFFDPTNHVLSFKVGFPKPDARMWQAALNLAQCPSENVVYIDDIRDLLASFERFCKKTNIIHYNCDREPSETLRLELTRLGVL